MSSIHDFIMRKGTVATVTAFLLGFFFFLFSIIFHSTLSLAVEGGSLFIQTNAPGANVYLDDNQIGKTDSKGGFLIDNIPPGTYKITVEMEGYKKAERTFRIKEGGLTEHANINLQPITAASAEPKVTEKKKEPPKKPEESIPVPKATVSPPPEPPKEPGKIEQVEISEKARVEEKAPPLAKKPFLGGLELWMILLIILLIAGIILLAFGKKFITKKEKPRLTIKTPVKPLRVTTPIKGISLEEAPAVGDYKILEKIASGGMANVYKAVHTKKGWLVALKVPHEQYQSDRTFVERFRREGDLGKKLHNENIIHIYEAGTAKDGFTFIAMEYLEGIDLRQYIDKRGKIPIEEAVNIMVHVCRALDYAHVKGVIHRDIKPENIMLPLQKGGGKIVLMDFGIAHTAYLGTVGTGSTYLGTPYYMSPDQISNKEVDGRSDIYSLGVVFFEMLTGQQLFNETDPLKVLFHHKETAPPNPSALNPKIPPTLEKIVLKMLAKNPDDRYQSVEILLVELQDFTLKEGIEVE
jgi:hypothetical protein